MIAKEAPMETASVSGGSNNQQCPLCECFDPKVWLTGPDRFNGRKKHYKLLRCPACSLVWLHEPPPPAEMGQHYGDDYDRVIASAAEAPDHWLGRRDEVISHKSGGVALDLGCGSGGFLSTLKNPSWKLYGIEMSEAMAKVAEHRSGADVFVGDILDAPFPPASFDLITCFNVFEHVYQPKAVLSKVSEWLKPGGIFYTLMPNIDSAGVRIFRSYWYGLELPRHLFHFSPATLRMIAQSVNLQEVLIAANRELFFESSMYYIVDDLLSAMGITRKSLAQAAPPHLAWKVVRKIFRLSVLPLLTSLASVAGDGETISAIFTKRVNSIN